MKNKKTIMSLAAILIVVYHLWINIFPKFSFLRRICFIGVDIFFFLSAYSIKKNNIKDYKQFLKSRFIKIYLPFIIFSVITFFYKNWTIQELILNILGISLLKKGGASFLWFIPSIMIVYILLPIYKKINNKHKNILILILWLISYIILNKINGNLLVFVNRIPIILIGFNIDKYIETLPPKKYMLIAISFLIIGICLLYKFEYISKNLNYIIAIPLILGVIMLSNLIPTNKATNLIGNLTLEMYAIQMIFGFKIASIVYNIIKIKILSNIVTIIVIVLLAMLYNYFYKYILKNI